MNEAADIERQAAEWLVRREGESWSQSDQVAFDGWVAESTANRIAVLRLETAWNKAGRLRASALTALDEAPVEASAANDAREGAAEPETRRRWRVWPALVAASLAAVAIPVYNQFQTADTYATPIGGFQQLPLADGSRVDLNTNTQLAVDYSGEERLVQLSKGEAFFKVAKDTKRPFVVQAGEYRVVAVGTAFTVKLRGREVEVVVTEGRVRIEGPTQAGVPARPTFASAGQTAVATSAAPVVRPVAAEEIDNALSWRDGLLIFDGRPLGDVAAEFNRYNRAQLVVDPSATGVIIDGTFRATNVDGFVRLLKQGFNVEGQREATGEIVLKKM